MSNRLADMVVLITGGGRGIGKATAFRFASEGAQVMIATRTSQPGLDVQSAIRASGNEASSIALDLWSRQDAEAAVRAVVAKYGALDIVVHNAAATPYALIGAITDEQIEQALTVNLKMAFWLAEAALPHLQNSAFPSFLCVSSITGNRQCQPGYSAYGASKAGINAFVRMAATELGAKGIRVNSVEPGLTLTEMVIEKFPDVEVQKIKRKMPLGRTSEPHDIANALVFLASREARNITGQSIVVDGGQSLVPA